MEAANAYVLLASNVGGFGVLAFVLWRLNLAQLRTFASQLRHERRTFGRALEGLQEIRRQEHAQGLERLDRLAEEVKRLADLWEK